MAMLLVPVDDFDKRVLATQRFVFVLDGTAYAIDLCDANIPKFRKDFRRYVEVSEKLGPATVTVNGETLGKAPKLRAAPYTMPVPGPTVETEPATAPEPKRSHHAAPATAPEPKRSHHAAPVKPTKAPVPTFTEALNAHQVAEPTPAELPFTEDDSYPPNKDWLYPNANERQGIGSTERRALGTRYRNAMRVWLRLQGFPVGVKGRLLNEWVDAYWDMIQTKRRNAKPSHHE